jgi:N-acetylmuramoyl-L-alanine amidase
LAALGAAGVFHVWSGGRAETATSLGPDGRYAAGACTSYPPATDRFDDPPVVFLDPGHGALDYGTSGVTADGDPVAEKDAALTVAMRARSLLLRKGFEVVMSRTKDTPVARLSASEIDGTVYTSEGARHNMKARLQCANSARADVLVSIHFNAFTDPSVGGAATYYDPARRFSARSRRLAGLLQSHIDSAFEEAGWTIPDRGVQQDTDAGSAISEEASAYGHLYLLGPRKKGFNEHPSKMPGALTEPLFLSNPEEASIIATEKGQGTLAAGIAEGIAAFLR